MLSEADLVHDPALIIMVASHRKPSGRVDAADRLAKVHEGIISWDEGRVDLDHLPIEDEVTVWRKPEVRIPIQNGPVDVEGRGAERWRHGPSS